MEKGLLSRRKSIYPGAADEAYERTIDAIQPSSTASVGFLLDINRWLERSGVTIRLGM
jgi:hypothetical protein